MEDLSLHILDIVENSITAEAKNISIHIKSDEKEDLLEMDITDDGKGIEKQMLKRVTDPFTTSKKGKRTGLGLSLMEQSAVESGGSLAIQSKKGKGTRIKATFKNSHIDRKPAGDIGLTLLSLVTANPGIDFEFQSDIGGNFKSFKTRDFKAEFEDIPINHPKAITYMRVRLQEIGRI